MSVSHVAAAKPSAHALRAFRSHRLVLLLLEQLGGLLEGEHGLMYRTVLGQLEGAGPEGLDGGAAFHVNSSFRSLHGLP